MLYPKSLVIVEEDWYCSRNSISSEDSFTWNGENIKKGNNNNNNNNNDNLN